MKGRFAFALTLALALVGAVGALLVSRFDAHDAERALREYVRDRYGRELVLDGALELKMWPVLAISVPGARLSETGSDEEMARFRAAEAEIAWLPLIRSSVIVERLRLHGLHLRVQRRADGSFNVGNLLDPLSSESDSAPGDEPAVRAPRVAIGRLEVSEASLEYVDSITGVTVWFDDLELALDEVAARMVTPVSLRARVVAAPGGPSVLLKVTGTLDLDPAKRSIGLRGSEASARGFLGARPLDINARARRAQIKFSEAGSALRLESFAMGFRGAGPSWAIEGAHVKGTILEFDWARLALASNAVELSARGKWGDSGFEASLALPDLVITDSGSRGRPVDANLRLRDESDLDLRVSLDGWGGGARDLVASKLSISADGNLASLGASLRLSGSVRADLDELSINVGQAVGNLSLEPGGNRPPLKIPLAGTVHAEVSAKLLATELETRVDNSLIKLRGSFDPAARGSALSLHAWADQIDSERFGTTFVPVLTAMTTPKPAANSSNDSQKTTTPGVDTSATMGPSPASSAPRWLIDLAEADWGGVWKSAGYALATLMPRGCTGASALPTGCSGCALCPPHCTADRSAARAIFSPRLDCFTPRYALAISILRVGFASSPDRRYWKESSTSGPTCTAG